MTTSILMALFADNQPYTDALNVPCDVVAEILEVKLDESLSHLEDDKPRLARKEMEIIKTFGSYRAYLEEMKQEEREMPTL